MLFQVTHCLRFARARPGKTGAATSTIEISASLRPINSAVGQLADADGKIETLGNPIDAPRH